MRGATLLRMGAWGIGSYVGAKFLGLEEPETIGVGMSLMGLNPMKSMFRRGKTGRIDWGSMAKRPHALPLNPYARNIFTGTFIASMFGAPLVRGTRGRSIQESQLISGHNSSLQHTVKTPSFTMLHSQTTRAPTLGATGDIVFGAHQNRRSNKW